MALGLLKYCFWTWIFFGFVCTQLSAKKDYRVYHECFQPVTEDPGWKCDPNRDVSKCIDHSKLCNKIEDCPSSKSDEETGCLIFSGTGCKPWGGKKYEKKCGPGSNQCVKEESFNHTADCKNLHILDIWQSCSNFGHESGFRCGSGDCVSISNVCDDVPQCVDGSDEHVDIKGLNFTNCENLLDPENVVSGCKIKEALKTCRTKICKDPEEFNYLIDFNLEGRQRRLENIGLAMSSHALDLPKECDKIVVISSCDNSVNRYESVLELPSYFNQSCTWAIFSPQNSSIILNLKEPYYNDTLKIYNGNGISENNRVKTFSNPHVVKVGSAAVLQYSPETHQQYQSFYIHYKTTDASNCETDKLTCGIKHEGKWGGKTCRGSDSCTPQWTYIVLFFLLLLLALIILAVGILLFGCIPFIKPDIELCSDCKDHVNNYSDIPLYIYTTEFHVMICGRDLGVWVNTSQLCEIINVCKILKPIEIKPRETNSQSAQDLKQVEATHYQEEIPLQPFTGKKLDMLEMGGKFIDSCYELNSENIGDLCQLKIHVSAKNGITLCKPNDENVPSKPLFFLSPEEIRTFSYPYKIVLDTKEDELQLDLQVNGQTKMTIPVLDIKLEEYEIPFFKHAGVQYAKMSPQGFLELYNEEGKLNLNIEGLKGFVFDSAKKGKKEQIEIIMNLVNDPKQKKDIINAERDGKSALYMAINADKTKIDTSKEIVERISYEIVEILIENGANVNKILKNNDKNAYTTPSTPLMLASKKGYTSIVNTLLQNKADILNTDEFRFHALYFALSEGKNDVVELLLKQDNRLACLKGLRHGMSPLHCAAKSGDVDMCELILSNLSRIGNSHEIDNQDNAGNTPVIVAAKFDNLKAVKCLLENDADIKKLNAEQHKIWKNFLQTWSNDDELRKLLKKQ